MVQAAHDALFRRLFADRTIAAAALSRALPAEVAERIDFSTLELKAGSHIDQALHAFQSDVVFSAQIAGREGRLLLLLEHQSTPDPHMPFRLLQYAVLLWDAYLRDEPRAQRLPVIVPVVWHHGPSAWRAPRDMLELLDVTEEERAALGRYAPRIRFELDDLAALSDAELRARAMPAEATLALAALRDVREASDVPALLGRWIDLIREAATSQGGSRALATVLRYVLEVHAGLDVDELRKIADEVLQGTGASIMATAHELMERGRLQGRAEGEAKGRQEGRQEGLLAGRRVTIAHMLRLKFQGVFTSSQQERVDAADGATLDLWEERILSATSIEEVLG